MVTTPRGAGRRRAGLVVGAVVLVVALVAVGAAVLTGGVPSAAEDTATLRAALPTTKEVGPGSSSADIDSMAFDPSAESCSGARPATPRAQAQAGFATGSDGGMLTIAAWSFEDDEQATAFYAAAIANLDCATGEMGALGEMGTGVTHEATEIEGADQAEAATIDVVMTQAHAVIARRGRYIGVAMSSSLREEAEFHLKETLGKL